LFTVSAFLIPNRSYVKFIAIWTDNAYSLSINIEKAKTEQ